MLLSHALAVHCTWSVPDGTKWRTVQLSCSGPKSGLMILEDFEADEFIIDEWYSLNIMNFLLWNVQKELIHNKFLTFLNLLNLFPTTDRLQSPLNCSKTISRLNVQVTRNFRILVSLPNEDKKCSNNIGIHGVNKNTSSNPQCPLMLHIVGTFCVIANDRFVQWLLHLICKRYR